MPSSGQYNPCDPIKYKYNANKIASIKTETKRNNKIEKTNAVDYGDTIKAYNYAYGTKVVFSPGKEKKISFAEH